MPVLRICRVGVRHGEEEKGRKKGEEQAGVRLRYHETGETLGIGKQVGARAGVSDAPAV